MSAESVDVAVLLADFVSSLDNLPSEVHHILQEIGHKEARAFDFRNRATSRDQGIQKHSRPPAQGGSGLLVPNPKEETQVTKARADFEKAEASAKEKVALAERGVKLLSRHLNRLVAQLETLPAGSIPPLPTLPSFTPVERPSHYGQPGYANAAGQYQYTNAAYGMGTAPTISTPGAYSAYGAPGDKRKSTGGSTPVQIPLLPAQLHAQGVTGYAYANGTPTGTQQQRGGTGSQAGRSRMSNVFPSTGLAGGAGSPPGLAVLQAQQQQYEQAQRQQFLQQAQQQQAHAQQAANMNMLRHQQQAQVAAAAHQAQAQAARAAAGGGDMAGNKRKRDEVEEEAIDGEGDGEGEDLTPYCICQRPSFGEMIGCDGKNCATEWFHLQCVGLKTTPVGEWFCPRCEAEETAKKAAGGGRKKNRS